MGRSNQLSGLDMPPQVGISHPQKIEAAHDSCKSPNDSSLAKERQSPKSNYLTLGQYVTHRAPPPTALRILLISCQQDTHWFVVATLVAIGVKLRSFPLLYARGSPLPSWERARERGPTARLNQTAKDSYTMVTPRAASARRSSIGLNAQSLVNQALRGLQLPL